MAIAIRPRQEVLNLRRCDGCPLANEPKVRGHGNTDHPPILFIAEAPGETEVKEGIPLVGRSGQFLRQLVRDLGINDKDCYYTNTCICRPPGNATPTAEMVHACYDGLMDEIESIEPGIIVTLGSVSTKAVGQYSRGVQSSRGMFRWLELGNRRVGIMPTYHPSAVLRTPDYFRDLVADLERAIRIVNGEPPIVEPPTEDYLLITTQKQLDYVFERLEKPDRIIAVDLETITTDFINGEIVVIGVSWAYGMAASIDWNLIEWFPENRERLANILKKFPISFQKGMFDIPWLIHRGFEVNLAFDTEIGHWLLDERIGGHSLERMAVQYYNAPLYKTQFRKRWGLGEYGEDDESFGEAFAKIPLRATMIYNASDSDYTRRLTTDLMDQLVEQGMTRAMKLLVDCTMLYVDFYMTGMWVDFDFLYELEQKLQDEADEAESHLMRMAPHVNPRSWQQRAKYLYDELELVGFNGKVPKEGEKVKEEDVSLAIASVEDLEALEYWQFTRISVYAEDKSGEAGIGLKARSTNGFMLHWLKLQHPYPKYLLAYNRARKRLRTYCGGIRKNVWPDGRLRPEYKLDGTVHGRFKTSKPAIHNIPARDPLYDVYVAPPGYVILHADYHQADMRVIAHFSGDQRLKKWLETDPHIEVVKEIGHFTDEDVANMTKDEIYHRRIAAKMVNFGLPYGRGAANLAPQMGMSVQEAKEYIKMYWKRVPDVKRWMNSRVDYVLANDQEVTSPIGTKRRFPFIPSKKKLGEAGRLAVNFPVMSTVNYMTALAHVRCVRELRNQGIDTVVYPHIHDSMNVCVPEENQQAAALIMARVMSRVPAYFGIDDVPFPIEVQAGYRWGTQETIYDGTGEEV